MRWDKGYSSEYYISIIDPVTWRDISTLKITGGSVKRELDNLRESANVDTTEALEGVEQWVRIWLNTKQDGGGSSHTPIFTGLATTPKDQHDGSIKHNALECFSVLKPASDIVLLRGWYAGAGSSGADLIRQLLKTTPAPVYSLQESPRLKSNIIADDSDTALTMADKILAAIDWRMRITGSGEIYIEPKPTEPAATLDPLELDIVEPEITTAKDLFDCPNVYLAIDNDLTAIARDDSPDSPLSIVNRGREIWRRETSCDLSEGETIERYAARKLKEAQSVKLIASYARRYLPDITPGDLLRLRYPDQDLDGIFRVTSQTVELGFAARTAEEVEEWTL